MTRARWDWYQATIRSADVDVMADLLAWFDGSWVEEAPVRLGYGEGWTVRDREGVRASVQTGGRNRWPNVTGSGEDAPAVAEFLRTVHPQHWVTRFDSCVDTDGTGAGSWPVIRDVLLEVADDRRQGPQMKVSMHGDWREGRGEDGRTLYLGAPSSAVRVRAYEKGKQLRAMQLPNAQLVPLEAVRVEVQVRPVGQARARAATVAPEDAWGFARFARSISERLWREEVGLIAVRDQRERNDDRALAFMVRQSGAMLERQARHRGGLDGLWEHVAMLLGAQSDGAAAR